MQKQKRSYYAFETRRSLCYAFETRRSLYYPFQKYSCSLAQQGHWPRRRFSKVWKLYFRKASCSYSFEKRSFYTFVFPVQSSLVAAKALPGCDAHGGGGGSGGMGCSHKVDLS